MSYTKKSIIIHNKNNYYEIPNPTELVKNIGFCYIIHYKKKDYNTKLIEVKDFFIENPDIFKLYFEQILNDIPDTFYMFIEQILYLIKSKNIIDSVDIYWQNMIIKK